MYTLSILYLCPPTFWITLDYVCCVSFSASLVFGQKEKIFLVFWTEPVCPRSHLVICFWLKFFHARAVPTNRRVPVLAPRSIVLPPWIYRREKMTPRVAGPYFYFAVHGPVGFLKQHLFIGFIFFARTHTRAIIYFLGYKSEVSWIIPFVPRVSFFFL